jgi:DNA-binding XRE family transcriptional regulator
MLTYGIWTGYTSFNLTDNNFSQIMKIDQKAKTSRSVQNVLSGLGASLRAWRLSNRLTHEDVASKCGFSRQTLSRIERGDPSVSVGQIAHYAEVLGVPTALAVDPAPEVQPTQRRVRRTASERALIQAEAH